MNTLGSILRPNSISQIVGQEHLVGNGMPLKRMAVTSKLMSTIIWGPPGTGKTSLVRALACDVGTQFFNINATSSSVKELRSAIDKAVDKQVIIFVDEIHRFSKSQQDVLLPSVENGNVVLFGATTENPKFAVNSTILSRCIVLETKPLSQLNMIVLLKKAKDHYKSQGINLRIIKEASEYILNMVSGDARKLLVVLQSCVEIFSDDGTITLEHAKNAIVDKHIIFDANGNGHFDLAHALQESIQHSDVDGALYWLGKWIKSGEDPIYICRRLLITAAEDCASNQDAWLAAMLASYTVERVGLPEGMIPMSLAVCKMATSKRDKSPYFAIKQVMSDIDNHIIKEVPEEMRAGTSGVIKLFEKGSYYKQDEISHDIYAIAQVVNGEFQMKRGPFPSLKDAIRIPGDGPDDVLLLFENGGSESKPFYLWNVDKQEWVNY